MRKIRQGMEIARLLLDLVGKRERLKQRQLAVMQELFEEQLLLGNEPLDPPNGKRKGKLSESKKQTQGKAESSRRKSTTGAVKTTMRQEIEEAVKKTSTTSRRKSGTALSNEGRKIPSTPTLSGDEDGHGSKRPRATKKRKQTAQVIDVVSTQPKKYSRAMNSKKQTKSTEDQQRLGRGIKRKREDNQEADQEKSSRNEGGGETGEQKSPPGKIKRVAKRRRRSASPTKVEQPEEESTVNIVDSDDEIIAERKPTKDHNEPSESLDEARSEEDDDKKDEEDSDQDYMKGKRKRKRRSASKALEPR